MKHSADSPRQRARECLQRAIERASVQGTTRLPAIAELAAAAGVSVVTMHRVVRPFVSAGHLTARPRKGLHVTNAVRPGHRMRSESQTSRHHRSSRSLAEQLLREVYGGVYESGHQLPPYKELVHRYGAAYETIRAALESLCERGVLERYRRGFRIVCRTAPVARNRLVVVTGALNTGAINYTSPRTYELVRELERQCRMRRLELSIVTFYGPDRLLSGDTDARQLLLGRRSTRQYLGCMVWTQGMSLWPQTPPLLRGLARSGLPMAVLDESGETDGVIPPGDSVAVIPLGYDEQCGVEVARYLLELGHRRVAYVCAFHANEWSRNRERGLRDEFRRAGFPDGVISMVSERYAFPRDHAIRNESHQNSVQCLLRERGQYHRARGEVDLGGVYECLTESVDSAIRRHAIQREIAPLVRAVLADEGVTAVVCATDKQALSVRRLLEDRGVRIPRDLSLVSFDDGPDALVANMTSYNFNCPAAVARLTDYVIAPGSYAGNRRTDLMRGIDGFVRVRGSSGPPAGAAP
ncbi:MAG: GntR family transcriptional regulator [Chitinivibrionales bacterium]|nr:GntR family transcriptional regulator [Chitinivibrionales bacterium]